MLTSVTWKCKVSTNIDQVATANFLAREVVRVDVNTRNISQPALQVQRNSVALQV